MFLMKLIHTFTSRRGQQGFWNENIALGTGTLVHLTQLTCIARYRHYGHVYYHLKPRKALHTHACVYMALRRRTRLYRTALGHA